MIGAAAACAAIVIQLHGPFNVNSVACPEADALGTEHYSVQNSNRFWWVLR